MSDDAERMAFKEWAAKAYPTLSQTGILVLAAQQGWLASAARFAELREAHKLLLEQLADIKQCWQEGVGELNNPWRREMAGLIGDNEGLAEFSADGHSAEMEEAFDLSRLAPPDVSGFWLMQVPESEPTIVFFWGRDAGSIQTFGSGSYQLDSLLYDKPGIRFGRRPIPMPAGGRGE